MRPQANTRLISVWDRITTPLRNGVWPAFEVRLPSRECPGMGCRRPFMRPTSPDSVGARALRDPRLSVAARWDPGLGGSQFEPSLLIGWGSAKFEPSMDRVEGQEPSSTKFRTMSTNIGRHRPSLSRCRQYWPNTTNFGPISGRCRPKWGRVRPDVESHIRPSSGPYSAKHVGGARPTYGPRSSNLGRDCPKLGRCPPNLADVDNNSGRTQPLVCTRGAQKDSRTGNVARDAPLYYTTLIVFVPPPRVAYDYGQLYSHSGQI